MYRPDPDGNSDPAGDDPRDPDPGVVYGNNDDEPGGWTGGFNVELNENPISGSLDCRRESTITGGR